MDESLGDPSPAFIQHWHKRAMIQLKMGVEGYEFLCDLGACAHVCVCARMCMGTQVCTRTGGEQRSTSGVNLRRCPPYLFR